MLMDEKYSFGTRYKGTTQKCFYDIKRQNTSWLSYIHKTSNKNSELEFQFGVFIYKNISN